MSARELGNPLGNPLALPRSTGVGGRGEISFTRPGTYLWTPPKGVKTVCAVLVGPGGAAYSDAGSSAYYSGGGGALAWGNDIPLTFGEVYTIVVGAAGGWVYTVVGSIASTATTAFGMTADCGITYKPGGNSGTGAPTLGNVGSSRGGGSGGSLRGGNNTGGGGAGGYTGNGGMGSDSSTSGATAGNGGGGGGGNDGGSGGGVGLYGQGANGAAGVAAGLKTTNGGGGGSFGSDGRHWQGPAAKTSDYGGGQGMATTAGTIGCGAVRILWGAGRAFPSTDVGPS